MHPLDHSSRIATRRRPRVRVATASDRSGLLLWLLALLLLVSAMLTARHLPA